jgi:lipoprotein-anchoring transpeptidase ErfK/SrfK
LIRGEPHAAEADAELRGVEPGARGQGPQGTSPAVRVRGGEGLSAANEIADDLADREDPPTMRTLTVTVVFAVAGLLALDLKPASSTDRAEAASARPRTAVAAPPTTLEVAFLRRGRLVFVERAVRKGTRADLQALKWLVQGPTRKERAAGLESSIPKDVRIRAFRPRPDHWHVSFTRSLFGPATSRTQTTRLSQISATLGRLGAHQSSAVISAAGRFATVIRPGKQPAAWQGRAGERGFPYSVRGVQLQLQQLGYLSPAQVTGTFDYGTSQALLAFQGWEGLARTATVTGQTQVALVSAGVPRPRGRRTGRYVEIHRSLGVLLAVESGKVFRAVHTSTGAGGGTPAGTFRVYRKETMSWSVPFGVWMPFASYFVGGIAMHEYPSVPEYPASHGCVRLPAGDAARLYRFAPIGTPVYVF